MDCPHCKRITERAQFCKHCGRNMGQGTTVDCRGCDRTGKVSDFHGVTIDHAACKGSGHQILEIGTVVDCRGCNRTGRKQDFHGVTIDHADCNGSGYQVLK